MDPLSATSVDATAGLGALVTAAVALGATRTREDRGDGDGDGGWRGDASEMTEAVAMAAGAGIGGFVAIVLWLSVLTVVARGLVGSLSVLQETVLLQVSNGLGSVTGVALYFGFTGRDVDFLDVRRPTRRDVGYAVAGLVAIFGAFVAVNVAMNVFGVESAAHGTSELFARTTDPVALAALFAVTSVLIIGPGEELLYRNVVQKSLYDAFSRPVAVVVASAIFALVHFSAYSTGTPAQVLFSLVIVFGLSLTLGAVYERTDSVVVPAVVHGLFNASQFLVIAANESDAIPSPAAVGDLLALVG